MSRQENPRPTDAELAILQVLWQLGDCTVRQVAEELNRVRPTGYTTVLKLMQIMTEKGLVLRDESQRTHVYRATRSEDQVQRQIIDHLAEKVFGGSATKLAMHALSARSASAGELDQIRQLLDSLEEEQS